MAAMYKLQKQVIGGFLDFIPHGETVDTETTGPTVLPDDDPIENWTEYSLGCVEQVQFEKEEETDEDYCPSETGGYRKEKEMRIVSDSILFTLQQHSEPIFRLLLGLNQKMTGATGQKIFENTGDRQITGWIRMRGVGKAGEALVLAKIEVKLRLSDYPGWSRESTKPVISCEVIDNDLNDIIDDEVLTA